MAKEKDHISFSKNNVQELVSPSNFNETLNVWMLFKTNLSIKMQHKNA